MKKTLFSALCICAIIIACNKEKSSVTTPTNQSTYRHPQMEGRFTGDSTDTFKSSEFIPISMANMMINSYQVSINSAVNDTDLESLSINADSLRAFLANDNITHVKLMFAHTMAYINAGNFGVSAGYQSGALTLVVAAYNMSTGNYVYYNGGMVLDHCAPCPYTCPPGAAGGGLLQ